MADNEGDQNSLAAFQLNIEALLQGGVGNLNPQVINAMSLMSITTLVERLLTQFAQNRQQQAGEEENNNEAQGNNQNNNGNNQN
jgi:hypothetical protein